jgi:hypothetical protein
MKNQYFGDVNDYRKYGILRLLSDPHEIRLSVCWMLTDDDGRNDGRFVEYLSKPYYWRHYDPVLFDVLYDAVKVENIRNVEAAETKQLLTGASYHTAKLSDNLADRRQYFIELNQIRGGHNLIFFDQDNGLEVKSVKKGRSRSSKYLYWDEFDGSFAKGHSILVYQHFPRVKRDVFIANMAKEMMARSTAHAVIVFQTSYVAFFLVPQAQFLDDFHKRSKIIAEKWSDQVMVHCL